MTDKDIIELYKKGYSISSIINAFYRSKCREIKRKQYVQGYFIIPKNDFPLSKCRVYVYSRLLEHNKGLDI